MLQLAFHPDVKLEIADAFKWYQQQAKGLGDAYISELELAFQTIVEMRVLGQSSKKTLGVIFFPDFLSLSYINRDPTLSILSLSCIKAENQIIGWCGYRRCRITDKERPNSTYGYNPPLIPFSNQR